MLPHVVNLMSISSSCDAAMFRESDGLDLAAEIPPRVRNSRARSSG